MDLLNPSMSTSLILSNWCSWSSFDCRSQVSFKEEHSFVFASFMLSAEWIMCRACFEAFLWQNKMQNAIVCKLDKAKYLQLQVCILWRCESMQAKIIMWKYASQVWQCVVSRLVWQALAKANMELGVLHLLTTAPKWNVMCDAKGQSGCLFFLGENPMITKFLPLHDHLNTLPWLSSFIIALHHHHHHQRGLLSTQQNYQKRARCQK